MSIDVKHKCLLCGDIIEVPMIEGKQNICSCGRLIVNDGVKGWHTIIAEEDEHEPIYLKELPQEEEDDSGRTHILGGVVDHGTHTTGVCSDECWCKDGEEE